jgi:hypothetical protein
MALILPEAGSVMSTHRIGGSVVKAVLASAVAWAALGISSRAASAQEVRFDLEDQMPTPGKKDQGRLSSLTLVKDGFGMRITRPGSLFDLCENPSVGDEWPAKPAPFGRVSLSTFFDPESATPLVIDFTTPVAAFSLDIGDYAQDVDNLEVEAFSEQGAHGQSLARAVAVLTNNDDWKFGFKHLEVRGEAIRSVRVICGSALYPHSMFYDNLTVEKTSSSG